MGEGLHRSRIDIVVGTIAAGVMKSAPIQLIHGAERHGGVAVFPAVLVDPVFEIGERIFDVKRAEAIAGDQREGSGSGAP